MRKRYNAMLVGLATTLLLSGCGSVKPTLLTVQQNENDSATQSEAVDSFSGKVTGIEEVQIVPKVSARIQTVLKDIGDSVDQGEALIQLDTSDLQALLDSSVSDLALAQAKYDQVVKGARAEDIRSAQAAYNATLAKYQDAKNGERPEKIQSLEAALSSAKVSFDNAKTKLDRTKALLESGAVSQQEYDSAVVTFKQAESQYETAKDSLKIAKDGATAETLKALQATVEQARAALDKAKNGATIEEKNQAEAAVQKATALIKVNQNGLANATVTSPIKGLVASKTVNVGELATIGVPMMSVVNIDQVYVTIKVPESELKNIKVDQKVNVQISSLDKNVKGKIDQISPKAESGTNRFLVKIIIDNPDHSLRSGMTANVKF